MRMLRRSDELACRQVVELITNYLEGALSRTQRRRFDAHLADCEHCSEYLAQMRRTIELTGRLRAEDLTPEMRDEFSTLYRRWREGSEGSQSRER
jgi:anti-sigma factor RsiW